MRRVCVAIVALTLFVSMGVVTSTSTIETGSMNLDAEWERTIGGAKGEVCGSVWQTSDGGYVLVGYTQTWGAGSEDVYLVKTDDEGGVEWGMTFGGEGSDWGNSVQQTDEGGYIIAGATQSFGAGLEDFYVIKVDPGGDVAWNRTFGGSSNDHGRSVQQTDDGGYIVTGYTRSFGAGRADVYLVKIDAHGDLEWNRTYGGPENDDSYSVQQTSDGGYVVAGHTRSLGAGGEDVLLIKTDSEGHLQYNRTFGGPIGDFGRSAQQASDGGYVIAGYTQSFGAGYGDVYLVRTDPDGNELWSRTYGGSELDLGSSVRQTVDGGYIIAGDTQSFGVGLTDVYLVLTDPEGHQLWNRTFGGSDHDHCDAVIQTADGGLVFSGRTQSFGTSSDVYLAKTMARDETPPTTYHDYDGLLHEDEFTIKLRATDDWAGVDDTYYRINEGSPMSVGEDGQPRVTTAGLENKLEYWSVDLEGNEENHRILTDITMREPASLNPAVIILSLISVLSLLILWRLRRR